ncbi:MAG: Lrp/AsnC family transcriptional regulator [Planctomycetota bacterium]|jgi:DNA-binding Lrp family transcriptional regulator
MDDLDCRILKLLQNDFPVSKNPYLTLGRKLNISSDELWDRITKMIDAGVIRRIGVSLDSHRFGYSSTLAAISIDGERVGEAAEIIDRFVEVTHSYTRKDKFNIWFTLIAEDEKRIDSILEDIREALSLDRSQVLNLPMKRMFKLDARFNIQA